MRTLVRHGLTSMLRVALLASCEGGNDEGDAGAPTAGHDGMDDCYSPSQNLDSAYDEGAVGCACAEGDEDVCIGRVALICEGARWQAVEDGPCEPMAPADAGPGCGARLGDTCADDEYCAYLPEQLCGAADATARCKPRPTACDAVLAPVCGCDGETYSNACEDNVAGTGLATLEACD